jgi:phosphoglucosamine mutase
MRLEDVHYRYLVQLKNGYPKDLDLIGFKIVVDCAHGAAYKTAPLVFEELGAQVVKEGVSPNGVNINSGVGALHPQHISGLTLHHQAHLGISLDGDGDRCILSDEKGEIVDGDQILGICALEMFKEGRLKGSTIVTTPMTNYGLEKTLLRHGIKMIRAKVGDRYVMEEMKKGGFNFGGEQSGHLIFMDTATTGDGIVAALKVLEIMRRTGKKLSELKNQFPLLPQVRKDIKIKVRKELSELPLVMQSIRLAESKLLGRGRVFVRFSGTENLCRVMLEGDRLEEIQELSNQIAHEIQKELG